MSEEEDVRMECSIIDTYLPANGNYSAYHEWGACMVLNAEVDLFVSGGDVETARTRFSEE